MDLNGWKVAPTWNGDEEAEKKSGFGYLGGGRAVDVCIFKWSFLVEFQIFVFVEKPLAELNDCPLQ